MRPDVARQFDWSAKFVPMVKQICGGALGAAMLTEATEEQDTKEASDLVVLRGVDLRIAVRVRQNRYLQRYPTQFTIRSLGRGGAWTEFDKILVEDFGDYLFYGFADETDENLAAWFIGDLEIFRDRICFGGPVPSYREMCNGPDDTRFACFDIADFPPQFLIAHCNEAIGTRAIA